MGATPVCPKRGKDAAGIYCIKNIQNGKVYVGQSTSLGERLSQHRTDLRCGRHKNGHLRAAVKKYGFDRFEFIVLEITDNKACLTELEQKWVDHFRANEKAFGYNIRKAVDSNLGAVPWNLGRRHDPATLAKIKAALRAYWDDPANRDQQSRRLTGRIINDEWREKITSAVKSRWGAMTQEDKDLALSPLRIGWKEKEPWKQAHWIEANAKINVGRPAHNKGTIHSEETKRKMREAWAARCFQTEAVNLGGAA